MKQEPIQCLKCRGWEHKALDCTAQVDTCGTCGDAHHTGDCTNKGKLHCASCKTNEHASWDRACPEFIRWCEEYSKKHLENNFIYFPTTQDWTLTMKPDRILLEQCLPHNLAAKNLPSGSDHNATRPIVKLPQSKGKGKERGREEGKLLEQTKQETTFEHLDTEDVEDILRHHDNCPGGFIK